MSGLHRKPRREEVPRSLKLFAGALCIMAVVLVLIARC